MTDARRAAYWRAELMSTLDQLSSLAADLRAAGDDFDPDLIAEADELLDKARRATGGLAALHPAPDGLGNGDNRGLDPLTIASTVGITTIVMPFVQSLLENAANDAYRALRGLVRRHRDREDPEGEAGAELILLCDRATDVRVVVDEYVDKAALVALRGMDLSTGAFRDATLRWDAAEKEWKPGPSPPRVRLWLPGDLLDDDWNRPS